MNIISIFIAGAKNLKEQRLGLKALTNDLNSRYSRLGWEVSLNMNSYENFGEKQSDYNDFISKQADLVIFVLKERIGKKTEEEYLLATNAFKESGHPEVITFVHAFDEKTEDIEHIEQFVNSVTDTYYVDFTNTEDLLAKAKDRINTFVEKRVHQGKKLNFGSFWKKGIKYATMGLLIVFLLFILSVLFSPENYLVVTTSDPPSSLVKMGIGKDFIKQQIVDGVRETGDTAHIKLEAILKELLESSYEETHEEANREKTLFLNTELHSVTKGNISNDWIWRMRKLLGKHDVQASVRLVESEHTYISRIILDTWEGQHDAKTIEINKQEYSSNQRCALNVIKKSAAYITKAYSPVASALYDYHLLGELEDYQMNSPWREDLYTHSMRESLLLENCMSDREEAPYGLLLLANFYEKKYLEHYSRLMAQNACAYYRRFQKQNSLYQSEVQSKIGSIETDIKQDEHVKYTIPDFLIASGEIPKESRCRQLIVVTDEETLYDKGTTYYKALLRTYEMRNEKWVEVYSPFKVNLGGRGMAVLNQKKEGDLKTPTGFYPIPFVFGYKKDIETKMDFIVVGKKHVWVCDTLSDQYNKMLVDSEGKYKDDLKNEKLYRPDILNKYAITIGYNMSPIIKGNGSAIFMHVERSANHKTAGCISMPEKEIKDLIKWLNPDMNPCIYISKRIEGMQ